LLISVRALSTALGGKASPQTLRPFSSQQYSLRSAVAGFCCAMAGSAMAQASIPTMAILVFIDSRPRRFESGRAAVARAVGEQALAFGRQCRVFTGKRKQVGQAGDRDDRDRVRLRDRLRG